MQIYAIFTPKFSKSKHFSFFLNLRALVMQISRFYFAKKKANLSTPGSTSWPGGIWTCIRFTCCFSRKAPASTAWRAAVRPGNWKRSTVTAVAGLGQPLPPPPPFDDGVGPPLPLRSVFGRSTMSS
jgi:hypothetical protein